MELLESASVYFHDNHISAPGNSKEKAVMGDFEKPLYAAIQSSGEENWYCFPVNTDSESALKAELKASDNLELEVYNEKGMLISSGSGGVIRLGIKTGPGNVYVKVCNSGSRYWSTYRLRLEINASD